MTEKAEPQNAMSFSLQLQPNAKADSDSGSNSKEDGMSATATTAEAAPARANWGNQVEFILTMVGYAVGLGNVWRFPYLCYKNGGGAFLIPYFGTLALVGLPIFYLELAFGQFASLGPIAVWTINPLFKGLGWSMVIINTMIAIYYNIIIGWAIFFFFASMTSEVPWTNCGNWWNTDACSETFTRNVTGNITDAINSTLPLELKTPSEEYFYNRVLQISGGIDESGTIVWQLALCLFLSWTTVFLVLIKGISSLGKVVYFSSIFPYVVLTIMLVRGVTLPGARDGIIYYLKPDFSRLSDGRAWSDAATQIFFSLSTCTGGLTAMASYNKFKNNCLRDSILVPIINCATSFYGGFAIFSVLGYMARNKGVEVSDVAASGPGLVFVVFPEALKEMPVAPLWSILFFIMMMMLGLSSEFSITETTFSAIIDEFPGVFRTRLRCTLLRLFGILTFYLIGLSMVTKGGFYLFNIVDSFVGGFPLLFMGLFECIAISYIYGYSNFADDIEMMLGKRPTIYIRICWCVISPLLLFVIIIFMSVQYSNPTLFSGEYVYPSWGQAIGWIIVAICIGGFPLWFFWQFLRKGGYTLLKQLTSPVPEWGPANPADRTGKYAILSNAADQSSSSSGADLAEQTKVSDSDTGSRTPPPLYQQQVATDGQHGTGNGSDGVDNVGFTSDTARANSPANNTSVV